VSISPHRLASCRVRVCVSRSTLRLVSFFRTDLFHFRESTLWKIHEIATTQASEKISQTEQSCRRKSSLDHPLRLKIQHASHIPRWHIDCDFALKQQRESKIQISRGGTT